MDDVIDMAVDALSEEFALCANNEGLSGMNRDLAAFGVYACLVLGTIEQIAEQDMEKARYLADSLEEDLLEMRKQFGWLNG